MNYYILKKHKAKTWLNLIACVDLLALASLVVALKILGSAELFTNSYLYIFICILVVTNMWFIVDYVHTASTLKKDKYRKDYIERQIRFGLVCHVFDANKSGRPIFFSKFSKARNWFYDKFDISKQMRDEIAVCMSVVQGCYKNDLHFSEKLTSFLKEHPIEDVYYTGICEANSSFPYMQCSKKFSSDGDGDDGMTLFFICETSFEFFEEHVEQKLKNCLYNQEKTVFPLTKLFETKDMVNRLSIKLEYHKLDIS